ncbi:MAG: hypothetical protein IKD08_06480, partial [Alphaproteobacteria bacterium]|nr:hypothetical protein [Alphaproteobacteria bacterium]
GWAGGAQNGGRGANSCDNSGSGGGSGYGGGGGGGCTGFGAYGGGGGGGYLRTSSATGEIYLEGGGTVGGNVDSTTVYGAVTYLGN